MDTCSSNSPPPRRSEARQVQHRRGHIVAVPSLSPFALVGNKLLMTTISMKPEILRRYSAHMGRSPGCKKTGMCFGDKPWFGHAVHTRKTSPGIVRAQERLERGHGAKFDSDEEPDPLS